MKAFVKGWTCGRIRREGGSVRRGFYKIPGKLWTTWSVVAGHWEYYLSRRNSPAQQRRAMGEP